MATVVAVVKTADNNNNFELLVSRCTAAVQTSRIWGDDASEWDRLFVGTPRFCSIQNLYGPFGSGRLNSIPLPETQTGPLLNRLESSAALKFVWLHSAPFARQTGPKAFQPFERRRCPTGYSAHEWNGFSLFARQTGP
jgi:hypothetical protein